MFPKPMMNVLVWATATFLVASGPPAVAQCCETAKLTASDAAAGDWFGQDVSVAGDWAVVAAPLDDDASPSNPSCNSGAVYVFRREGAYWFQHQKCTGADRACADQFGHAVCIRGDYFVVGANGDDDDGSASGSAYVFCRNDNGTPEDLSDDIWAQEAKLTAADAAAGDQFGFVVSIWSDYVLVGSVHDDDAGSGSGSAYIFWRDDNSTPEYPCDDNWTEQAKLTAGDAASGDQFGVAVSICGDYALVGSWWDDDAGNRSGSAYVFCRDDNDTPAVPNDDTWVEQAKLTASDAAAGDEFGGHWRAVSICGDYAVVGASKNDDAGGQSGAAYVFCRVDSGTPEDPCDDTWVEMAKLTASDAAAGDFFGQAVSICGDHLVIGTYDDTGPDPGWMYVFRRDDNGTPQDPCDDTWVEEYTRLTASDAAPADKFAAAVACDGVHALAGAYYDDDNGSNSGSAYVFAIGGPDCNSNGVPDECDILGGTSLDADTNGVPDECEVVVPLDIKPGSCPNPLNRGSHGVLPVALLGTADLDATMIDVSSVRLGRADGIGGLVAPHEGPPGPHSVFEDVGTPFDGETCDCHDAGTDGFVDLSMKFKTDDVVADLLLDELDAGALVELVVTGELLDGTGFAASDCVRLVPPGTPPGLLSVQSSVAGAWIDVDPLDETLDAGGFADFQRGFPLTTVVTLTAEDWADGRPLRGWQIGGLLHHMGEPSIEFAIDQDMTVRAVYGPTPSSGSPKPPGEMTPDELVPEAMQGQSAEAGTIDRR